jgi:SAM-dependent methyltransferase
MGVIGGRLGYTLLKAIAPARIDDGKGGDHAPENSPASALQRCFGADLTRQVTGKTVIDFGCGEGADAVALAQAGAARVIGLDIRPALLAIGQARAQAAGVADRCEFTTVTDAKADLILSKDAFEHFDDPAGVLRAMASLLKPNGCVLVSFGPTWLHPHGGHLFSVFPWSHLLFTEKALLRWRSDFKRDGATRFAEVDGGLNQMTIRRFEALVFDSPLRLEALETVPIAGLKRFGWRPLREFTTSFIRCRLVPRRDS